MERRKKDVVEKLVEFLAKRDGIDKVVKTMQYAGKLGHYYYSSKAADCGKRARGDRCRQLEVAAGMSRKAFRMGRFLAGFSALRTTHFPDHKLQVLSILGYGGEMVYWLFDNLLWLSRVGVLHPSLSPRMGFVSAFGEGFGYVFFIAADLLVLRRGLQAEARLAKELRELQELQAFGVELDSKQAQAQVQELVAELSALRIERLMCVMSIIANVSDFIIALADVEPENSFASHPITLGISGLASAWSGWYKNWPDS